MATLVTLEEAKRQLRITDTFHDAEVQAVVDDADAIIRRYLKKANDPLWNSTSVPFEIKAAVKLMIGHLYEHRGDEWGESNEADDRTWSAVGNLLVMWRDPALA
jgi:hypothetical protein